LCVLGGSEPCGRFVFVAGMNSLDGLCVAGVNWEAGVCVA